MIILGLDVSVKFYRFCGLPYTCAVLYYYIPIIGIECRRRMMQIQRF